MSSSQVYFNNNTQFDRESQEFFNLVQKVGSIYYGITGVFSFVNNVLGKILTLMLVAVTIFLSIPLMVLVIVGLTIFFRWFVYKLSRRLDNEDYSVTSENYEEQNEHHKNIVALIKDLESKNIEPKLYIDYFLSKDLQKFLSILKEHEMNLRQELYPKFEPSTSIDKIELNIQKLDKFAEDWDDDDMDIYDQVYTPKKNNLS